MVHSLHVFSLILHSLVWWSFMFFSLSAQSAAGEQLDTNRRLDAISVPLPEVLPGAAHQRQGPFCGHARGSSEMPRHSAEGTDVLFVDQTYLILQLQIFWSLFFHRKAVWSGLTWSGSPRSAAPRLNRSP